MICNNREGSIGPVLIAVGSAVVIILLLLGWYPKDWFKNLFSGSDKLALIGSFGDFKDGTNIDDAAKTIVNDLTSAQSNSKTENTKWGVCFRNPAGGSDFYDIVSNILVSPDDACTIGGSIIQKSNIDLPKGIDFLIPASGHFTSVVFNVNGTTNSDKDIVIEISNGNDKRFIFITPLGVITYGSTSTAVVVAPAPNPTSTTTPSSPVVSRTLVIKPGAPTNINIFNSNGSVTISWDAPVFNGNAPITQYRVYRSFVSNGVRYTAGTTIGDNRIFTDAGLVNGSIYYYHITAFNFLFEGPESYETSGAPNGPIIAVNQTPTNNTLPNAPNNLSAYAISSSQINVSWQAPSYNGSLPVTEYRLYRSAYSNGPLTYIASLGNSNNSYTDYSLQSNTTYYYKIVAVNQNGPSNYSNEAFTTTQPVYTYNPPVYTPPPYNPPQPCPTGYAGTYPNCVPPQQPCPTGYTGTYPNCVPPQQPCPGGYSGTYPNCTPVNNNPNPPVYNSPPQTTAPNAPNNLSASPSTNLISLSWLAPSSNGGSLLTEYRLYRSNYSNGPLTYIAQLSPASTNYADNNVVAGTKYYYKIVAVNQSGLSNYSNEVSATVSANNNPPPYNPPVNNPPASNPPANNSTVPPAPILTATPSQNQINLSWSIPANNGSVTEYRLYRSTYSNGPLTYIAQLSDAISNYVDPNLNYNTTYYYKAIAVNQYGRSNYSTEAWATTGISPTNNQSNTGSNNQIYNQNSTTIPNAPNLSASGSGNQVNLSWSDNGSTAITSYTLYRTTYSGGPLTNIAQPTSGTHSYADTNLSYNTTYYYKIVASNQYGKSGYSPEAWATTGASTSNNPGTANISGSQASNQPSVSSTAPSTPTLSARSTPNQIALSWNVISNAASYTLYRTTYTGGPLTNIAQINNGSTSTYTDYSNLSANTTYYYKMIAENQYGKSNYSTEAWATTAASTNNQVNTSNNQSSTPCGSLTPPRYLSAIPSTTPRTVNLSWQAPTCDGGSAIIAYDFYRGTSDNKANAPYIGSTSNGSTYSFTDTWNLNSNQTYYYWVSARNGNSQTSYYSDPSAWATTR